jgi:hypothetical protein
MNRGVWAAAFVLIGLVSEYTVFLYALPYLNLDSNAAVALGVAILMIAVPLIGIVCVGVVRSLWRN